MFPTSPSRKMVSVMFFVAAISGCGTKAKSNNPLDGTAIQMSLKETSNKTVQVAQCAPVNLDIVDSTSNVIIPSPADVSMTLIISGPTSDQPAIFYTDAACQTAGASVTIPSGSNGVTMYLKSAAAGSATVTASASGFASNAGMTVTFQMGSIQLVLDTSLTTRVDTIGNQCQGVHLLNSVGTRST